MSVTELLELGTKPIRPDAPAGEPGRDAPEFETLQLEVRKLELPEQPPVNWDLAIKCSSVLLSGKSKDLLIASYLCVALLERDGIPGFATGLTILRDLIANYWDTLFPDVKRLRGRVAAFEWLAERGSRSLQRPRRAAPEVIAQCIERVAELDERLGPLFDSPPMLGELRRGLEDLASASAPPPAAQAAGGTAAVEYVPSGPPPIDAVASPEDLDRAMEEITRLGDLAASFLRASEPAEPFGYRFLRMVYWRQCRELPPNEDGMTVLPDFDVAVLEQLDQLRSSDEHAAVLEQTESLLLSAPLWLDLTRYAVQALEAQGEAFAPAVEAVVFELATLLKRVPGLAGLKTSGGVPFADDATRKWLTKRVLAGTGVELGTTDETVAAGARPRGGEGFAAALQEAKKLVRQKKLGDALALLEKGAQRAERLDDRVAWKLEVAKLCMNAGRDEMALAQLEALDEELRRATIEDWDPQMYAEVLKSLLQCRQKVAASTEMAPAEVARARELMGRLCRLDLLAALALDGKR